MIRFLTIADTLTIHTKAIHDYGGTQGIRDCGLLDSALAQPQLMLQGIYMHPTLADMAAAYMFHIIKNHPFIDGNKRTGTACAWIFLSINSANPQGSAQILENTALGVAESLISKKELGQIFQCFVLSNA